MQGGKEWSQDQRRGKNSLKLLEDDDLDTEKKLPINAILQPTKEPKLPMFPSIFCSPHPSGFRIVYTGC